MFIGLDVEIVWLNDMLVESLLLLQYNVDTLKKYSNQPEQSWC